MHLTFTRGENEKNSIEIKIRQISHEALTDEKWGI